MPAKPRQLAPNLTKRLLAYGAVAGTVAAGASHAAAEVVYTPVHKFIDADYSLDLNNDGIGDFNISTSYLSGFNQLLVAPLITFNKVVVVGKGCILHQTGAAPLPPGAIIGREKSLRAKSACMASLFSWYSDGPWVMQNDRYLGVEFVIDGKSHYGWARFNVGALASAVITGYAYETVPNKAIRAGDEGSASDTSNSGPTLGELALGVRAQYSGKNGDKE